MNDGRVLPIDLLDESPMKVRYKKCDDPLNRTWGKDKTKINRIVTAEGQVKRYDRYHTDNTTSTRNKRIGLGILGAVAAAIGGIFAMAIYVVLL